ncbi:MAG: hypothetical protein NVS9B5_34470 [Terriglobales bacterium]
MKVFTWCAVFVLGAALSSPVFAQGAAEQGANQQANQQADQGTAE